MLKSTVCASSKPSPLRNLAMFSRKFQMSNSSKTVSFLNQEITAINVSPLFCEMGQVQKQDLAGHGRWSYISNYVKVWYQKY